MDDRTFFDLLYQQWTKTTGAEDRYWQPEAQDENTLPVVFNIYAVHESDDRKLIASDLHSEADADFLTAVHGCFGDLVKRLHSAVDEADRLDLEKDDLVNRVAVLEMEADEFSSIIKDLTEQISDLESGRV